MWQICQISNGYQVYDISWDSKKLNRIIPNKLHSFFKKIHSNGSSEKLILDFKNWWPIIYKKNTVSFETNTRKMLRNEKPNFTSSRSHHFKHDASNPDVTASPFINSPFNTHTFHLKMPNASNFVRLQSSKASIKKTKINHIRHTIKYISEKYSIFRWYY